MKNPKNFSKYISQRKAKIWAITFTVALGVLYIFILSHINSCISNGDEVGYFYYVFRDVSVVLFTIALTSIISTSLIDIRDKNDIYKNAVFEDVIANPVFFEAFSDSAKRNMLKRLEQELLFSNSCQLQEMYSSIKSKMSAIKKNRYFYNKCDYHVQVIIKNGVITKKIHRTLCLRSYFDDYDIDNLSVVDWSGFDIDDHFGVTAVMCNSRSIPFVKKEISEENIVESYCGYMKAYTVYTAEPVHLSSKRDTIISVDYYTKVPLSDNIYNCRTHVPCKQFSVDVTLMDSQGYKLYAVAYGFADTAKSSSHYDETSVKITFSDWIFNYDGVSIIFAESENMN